MKILVVGSTGFIGSSLVPYLESKGHQVHRLVRAKVSSNDSTIFWDPYGKIIEERHLEGFDAVINLAGENIASGRWTEEKKRRIRESRVYVTRYLCELLTKLERPPKVLINASAIGYYGDTGDHIATETSPAGSGFLSGVCREWEAASFMAFEQGVRVVNLRIGVVIGQGGGILSRMLLPFKLGLGGVVGSGKQYMSWIALEDLNRLVEYCLSTKDLKGPVNAVAPHPVTNYEFTKTLGGALKRPTIFSIPAFAARGIFGEMAESLMLGSSRVFSEKISKSDFKFLYPDLEPIIKGSIAGCKK